MRLIGSLYCASQTLPPSFAASSKFCTSLVVAFHIDAAMQLDFMQSGYRQRIELEF